MQGSNNREWLIKSSGEIKGPYTFEEVARGIISKEFILVDEISKSFNRWKYLREEEEFERVITEHKNKEYLKNEKTFTNSETDSLTEDLSKQVLNFGGEKILSNVTEHLKDNEEARITQLKAKETEKKFEEIHVKNYALEEDLRKQASDKSSFFRIFILLLVIGSGAAFYYLNKKEKVLSYDDLKKMAYDNMSYGNFEDAKFYLEKALAVNSTNEELKYLLSYVSVELDDTVTAQRLVSDLSNTVKDKKMKSQIFNLSGIMQLKNFNLEEAKKNFDTSLNNNPKFAAAFFNKGVAFYLDNKFDLAYQNFTQSLVNGGLDGSILLSMAEMSAKNGTEAKSNAAIKKQVEDIINLVTRQSQNLFAYKQELKIAAAYLHFIMEEKQSMEKLLEDAVNVDPFLTSDHVLDVAFYKGLVTWDRMVMWIKKMKDAYPKNENLRSLYGYALFKGSEKLKGKDILEGLLKSDYSNTSNQILLSYALMTLKRDDDAKATLAPIMHHRDKSLSFVLMGRICLIKKDFPCADLNYSEALRIDKDSLPAMAGLAQTYYELKDLNKSRNLAARAYKMSPVYKPILSLKRKLEIASKE
ncbi:MAG: hypothetical protein V4596_02615 [Bdellovibrionota bacterium]